MADVSKPKQAKKFNKNFPKRKISNDYALKKRPPSKNFHHENAVYVTTKTDIKALIKKCENYFNKNINEIIIYCIGAAIERGINLSLLLTEKYPSFQLAVNTSTITLTDDLEPLTDEVDYEVQKRENSVVHIRVFRENPVDILTASSQQ